MKYITDALAQIERNISEWKNEYAYDPHSNEYHHRNDNGLLSKMTEQWFEV